MTASLKAEWLKLVTTRGFWALTVAAALVTALVNFGLIAQGPPPWRLTVERFAQLGSVSAISLGLFCLIVGLRAYTEEFRYGTIVHTRFSDPLQTRTALAKAAVAAAGALVLGAVSVGLAGLAVYALTGAGDGAPGTTGLLASALGLLGGGALWAVLGVGLGAIVRQPVAAMVTGLLWVLVFENVAGLFLGPVARYLPGPTTQTLARGTVQAADLPMAVAVMAAWTAALWVIGWTALRRRDVA